MTDKALYSLPLLLASDHAGFDLKQELKKQSKPFLWKDLGCFSKKRTDYPDWADKLCKSLQGDMRAVLICGTGQGMAMRANRHPHVRAALCWNQEIAQLARKHNKANVLCLPGRFLNVNQALSIVKVFMESSFDNQTAYQRRVKKLSSF